MLFVFLKYALSVSLLVCYNYAHDFQCTVHVHTQVELRVHLLMLHYMFRIFSSLLVHVYSKPRAVRLYSKPSGCLAIILRLELLFMFIRGLIVIIIYHS